MYEIKNNQKDASTNNDTTYVQGYGIYNNFIARSKLIKKHWLETNANSYLTLGGYWKDNSTTAIYENYFVVESINNKKVKQEDVQTKLEQFTQATIENHYGSEYAKNVSFFSANSSLFWEYPILSPIEANEIVSKTDVFSYAKILRYAFASSYAYSLESGKNFEFENNSNFKALMLNQGRLDIIDSIKDKNGVYAVAIKVPAISKLNLAEEIIIAYKGTNPFNTGDLLEDIKLFFANLKETDIAWQETAYQFCQNIIKDFPPNSQSLASGYQRSQQSNTYNVVLTGHSLGGYTAVDSGVRTGIQTRVFASPGTKIVDEYAKWLANTMRLRNVINFRCEYDVISSSIMRHDENEVEFPTSGTNPHSLSAMITEILEKLYIDPNTSAAQPKRLFVTPDATIGAGLDARINRWGVVEYTNSRTKELETA